MLAERRDVVAELGQDQGVRMSDRERVGVLQLIGTADRLDGPGDRLIRPPVQPERVRSP